MPSRGQAGSRKEIPLHTPASLGIDLQTLRGKQGTLLRIQLTAQVARVNSRDQMKLFKATFRPADDDEPSFHWQDTHHSNESSWKPKEVPLDEDRILVLDVD